VVVAVVQNLCVEQVEVNIDVAASVFAMPEEAAAEATETTE